MSKTSKHDPTVDFFALIPRRSIIIFLCGVFFVFAPVSLLLVSSFAQQRSIVSMLFMIFLSGTLAVFWAATFTVSRWFAPGIVVMTLAVVAFSWPLARTTLGVQEGTLSFEGVGLVVLIVLGYVLFISFINGQGRTTLRLMTEMALARRIHETLVPPIEFAGDGVEAYGVSVASSEMGGDLIDIVTGDDATDLFLVDVSGHGVRAGVVMGMIKSALRMGLRRREGLPSLVGELNEVLDQTTGPEIYATMAALTIGHGDRNVGYVLAGHHPILHYRAATSKVDRIEIRNFPVGMMADQVFETGTVSVEPGDLFALYTDGLNETADTADRELGHEPIEKMIVGQADRPLAEIHRAVLDLVEGYGRQEDDRTLLLVRMGV